MNKAIVLVSGGMDSCVTAACAIEDGFTPVFLHINYGQRTENRELKAFNDLTEYFEVREKLIIDITHLSIIGNSCLTDHSLEVPNANLTNNNIPISYVPFRNANILSVAVSWAETNNSNAIYIGAVEEDSSGYPDCRKSFFKAFENVIKYGSKPNTQITIQTPLISLSKKEIIEKGVLLNAPLHLTWSCYKNEDVPCNQCDSCALRAKGFSLANLSDPIIL